MGAFHARAFTVQCIEASMATSVFWALLVFAQINTLQSREVVHLKPQATNIEIDFRGKLLELINSPAELHLPPRYPGSDSNGVPWNLDVKNSGPGAVTITGAGHFTTAVAVGQTIHLRSDGRSYFLTH